ncbi:hypothetical protein V1477_009978, partial [Vespula maculifrons]
MCRRTLSTKEDGMFHYPVSSYYVLEPTGGRRRMKKKRKGGGEGRGGGGGKGGGIGGAGGEGGDVHGGWWWKVRAWGIIEGATALTAHSSNTHRVVQKVSRLKKPETTVIEVMTSSYLVAYMLVYSTVVVHADRDPLPADMVYTNDNFAEDTESVLLVNRLKELMERKQEIMEQERELTEEQLTIQAMLQEKARDHRLPQNDYSQDDAEILPVPSAIVHHAPLGSIKRTSCKFEPLPFQDLQHGTQEAN